MYRIYISRPYKCIHKYTNVKIQLVYKCIPISILLYISMSIIHVSFAINTSLNSIKLLVINKYNSLIDAI